MGMIDDLFMIDGIEKVKSSFKDIPGESYENVCINISYNPNIISVERIKEIEEDFNS